MVNLALPAKDRDDQREQNADDNAGHDREIETPVIAFDPNITRQTAQPLWGKAAPEDKTNQSRDSADYH